MSRHESVEQHFLLLRRRRPLARRIEHVGDAAVSEQRVKLTRRAHAVVADEALEPRPVLDDLAIDAETLVRAMQQNASVARQRLTYRAEVAAVAGEAMGSVAVITAPDQIDRAPDAVVCR